jgi:hypothetical protein
VLLVAVYAYIRKPLTTTLMPANARKSRQAILPDMLIKPLVIIGLLKLMESGILLID